MNLPEGLDSIGNSAFWSSFLLRNVVIPESAIHLGIGAFAMTDSLRSLTIPQGITEIPDLFLAYSNEIDTIIIPDGVIKIGACAFQLDYDLCYIKLLKKYRFLCFRSDQYSGNCAPANAGIYRSRSLQSFRFTRESILHG